MASVKQLAVPPTRPGLAKVPVLGMNHGVESMFLLVNLCLNQRVRHLYSTTLVYAS